jgi:hypothetical protein
MAIDRDRDTWLDGDELAAGSDPGDPASTPDNVGVPEPTESGFNGVRPNPFRADTEVRFALARPGAVECAVFDVMGRQIVQLARGEAYAAGPHRLRWDGRRDRGGEVGAGVYFVRLRTHEGTWTRTVVRVP